MWMGGGTGGGVREGGKGRVRRGREEKVRRGGWRRRQGDREGGRRGSEK